MPQSCTPMPCPEPQVQPYLQKFLTALLTGARTDSELKGDYHSLFYAVCAPLSLGAGVRLPCCASGAGAAAGAMPCSSTSYILPVHWSFRSTLILWPHLPWPLADPRDGAAGAAATAAAAAR